MESLLRGVKAQEQANGRRARSRRSQRFDDLDWEPVTSLSFVAGDLVILHWLFLVLGRLRKSELFQVTSSFAARVALTLSIRPAQQAVAADANRPFQSIRGIVLAADAVPQR
jgi:hypothetical protein